MIEEARSKCSFDIDDMSLVIYTKEFLNKYLNSLSKMDQSIRDHRERPNTLK